MLVFFLKHYVNISTYQENMSSQFMTVLTIKWPSSLYKHNPLLMVSYGR